MSETRAPPNDKPLGEPKRRFEDTFSAATVLLNKFFPRAPTAKGEDDGTAG